MFTKVIFNEEQQYTLKNARFEYKKNSFLG